MHGMNLLILHRKEQEQRVTAEEVINRNVGPKVKFAVWELKWNDTIVFILYI